MDDLTDTLGPRRLRKAETVLSRRTTSIILVLEAAYDSHNHMAVLRTTEAFGIQHVWIVEPQNWRNREGKEKQARDVINKQTARQSVEWLSIRSFPTTKDCLEALNEAGVEIWATELGQDAECLRLGDLSALNQLKMPPQPHPGVAIVIGRETDGVSEDILASSHKRLYLDIQGWAESFNLSVASALILQLVLWANPDRIRDISEEEKAGLRPSWYAKLTKNEKQEAENKPYLDNPPPPFSDLRRPDVLRELWTDPKMRKKDPRQIERQKNLSEQKRELGHG